MDSAWLDKPQGRPRGEPGLHPADALQDESLRRVIAFARRKRRFAWTAVKFGLLLLLWSIAAAALGLGAMVIWEDVPAEELLGRLRLLWQR